MHKLLDEQINRFLGSLAHAPEGMRELLNAVNDVYQEADLMRARLENSRDNNSDELLKRQGELQRYAKRLETLHEIDREILRMESPQDIACAAIKRLREVLGIKMAIVSLADFETNEMIEVCVSLKEGLDKSSNRRYVLEESTMSALRKGSLLVVKDLEEDASRERDKRLLDEGVRGYLRVPLIARDHVVGLLEFGATEPNAFHQEDIEIAQEVADQVAVSLQQAALLDEVKRLNENLELRILDRTSELERHAYEITLLNDMGELLQSCVNSAEAYKVIAQHLPRIFPYLEGGLGVLTNSGQSLEFTGSWGVAYPVDTGFSKNDCWALRRGQPHLVEEIRPGLLCKHVEEDDGYQPWYSTFCIPLLTQSEAIGVLYLRNKRHAGDASEELEEQFTNANRQLAMTVAEQIALALANLNLQETLRIQAIRDPITGLFNRRYMEESLVREIQRSARNKNQLGVIMLDIDHFKEFNDKYGHAVGDAMLRELGSFLQEKVRQEDIACKYGGEEFVLILPNTSLEITEARAELIRRDIKLVQIEVDGTTFENITLSCGVSIFPDHGEIWEHLLRAADVALYQAKANGRDQVVAGKPYKKIKKKASETQTSYLD
ncbi:MAG: sensor domain-containing diguanylate cyclase [Chloroflexi bacterium]|nr:sensor domain-containing diguanylate cyclase [Chloroflexota bacterium]